jgi:hypothetical protein
LARPPGQSGSGVIFLLDEIQFLDQGSLEALISALHRVAQRELPLALVGGGLPSIPRLAGEAKSYAERLFRFPRIGRLDRDAATDALILPARDEGVEYEDGAVGRILELSEGYPYFLQEYGRHVWQVASESPIRASDVERAHPLVLADLDEGFFTVRFERATDAERRYMAAMAVLGDGPQQSGQVARKLGYKETRKTSVTRSDLIDKASSTARSTGSWTSPCPTSPTTCGGTSRSTGSKSCPRRRPRSPRGGPSHSFPTGRTRPTKCRSHGKGGACPRERRAPAPRPCRSSASRRRALSLSSKSSVLEAERFPCQDRLRVDPFLPVEN